MSLSRLTDPDAGQVDDLVLVRRGRTDAYQFKSVEFDRFLTFRQVIRDQHTRGGARSPSLVRSLADGWERLASWEHNLHVHLVTNQLASINDHLSDPTSANKPSPDHFSAFLDRVLRPIRSGEIAVDDVPVGWEAAVARLREATGLAPEAFDRFLQSLHFDLAAGSGVPTSSSRRRSDITDLSSELLRLVSKASDVVELDTRGLLKLMGWTDRLRLHSIHEFPVDLDTYAPLIQAIDELNEVIYRHDSGYIAVVGSPGAGKSTLLSQALTGTTDRVVRYYAYVPRTTPARTRLTARGFLHDVGLKLHESGLKAGEHQLVSNDLDELRLQRAEQFDAASVEFASTQRRTIVIVDGLDHVDREFRGNDSLLAELPLLGELPDGVLLIVGSRTTAPLRADARQQVEERQTIIDLQDHRLPSGSVLEICRRAPVTADLSRAVHQQIVELSEGHPLALSYLLNRLRDADGQVPCEVLATAPAYAGDVAAQYRAVWDEVEDDDDLFELLSVCSRLRIGFTSNWLSHWAPETAVRRFRRKLLYLFREQHDGWGFFHDSFRQFAADRTALGDDGCRDADADARAHGRVSKVCAESESPHFAAEQLYHRICAGQDEIAFELAQQATFREQYRRLRSPALIREDITLALGVAADHANVRIMLRLLLALVEVGERTVALESVNMPELLYESGLIDEAISYCAVENQHVPLAHVYDLAARLGAENNSAGRQLFDSVEHHGFDDSERARVSGEEDEAAEAWAKAAVFFRPLRVVISAIRKVVEQGLESRRNRWSLERDLWPRYARMMSTVIDWAALRNDESALETIDSALGCQAAHLIESRSQKEGAERNLGIATVIDLRIDLLPALPGLARTADSAQLRLDALLTPLRGMQLFASTILYAAEIAASYGLGNTAERLLSRTSYDKALSVSVLTYGGDEGAVDGRFRYWRLHYLLASSDDSVPESIPLPEDMPAGKGVRRDAPVHDDAEAIELAARIDAAIRMLGHLDASIAEGQAMPEGDVWTTLARLLHLFDIPVKRRSSTLHGIMRHKLGFMSIIADVAIRYGIGLPQRLSDELARCFEAQQKRWPLRLRLDLAEMLRSAGASVPWYRETLNRQETQAANQDVHSRLDDLADLVHRHARNGDERSAQRLGQSMIEMAFGIGYRKDYQFNSWVTWLGRALAEPGGDRFIGEAAWLARVINAIEPTTEGAPRSAAVDLPAAVVPAEPMAAVRIFEYLVRHGTVHHLDALAALVRALVTRAGRGAFTTIELAADIVGELLAPAANEAYPDLAAAVVAAAKRAAGRTNARELAEAVARRTDSYALGTTRTGWRRGLGLLTSVGDPDEDDGPPVNEDYGALILSSGRRIARVDVDSHIQTVADIVELRRDENSDSYFSWTDVIAPRSLTSDDVQKLAEVFGSGAKEDVKVIACLAEAAERNGDDETALRLAFEVIRSAAGEAWATYYGGARLRAAAVIVRLGDEGNRVAVCRDLARQVISSRWFASMLRSDFEDVVRAMDPDVDARSIWPEIRTHLDGIAEKIDLVSGDPLTEHGCRWWLLEPTGDRRAATDKSNAATALAELAVGHLSHPTWLIRDAASVVVINALVAGNTDVAEALVRFTQAEASDDILERAGRCLAAARIRDGYVVPEVLQPLERLLAKHPSQVLRDLAAERSVTIYRPLPPMYDLMITAPVEALIGRDVVFPYPYELQYRVLAQDLDLDSTSYSGLPLGIC